jgi:hypothetical protein
MSHKIHGGDSKSQVPTDGGETKSGASRVFQALAVLRSIRDPRKSKLGLRDAIAAAIQQGEAFAKWCETGTPVKRIQVWMENQLVITVDPEDIANLKSVQLDAPSSQNAVMQVLKADERGEPVVLFNVSLNKVRSAGFDETVDIPNGQRIRLVIAPVANGRFEMVVAFLPEEGFCTLPDPEVKRSLKANAVGATGLSKPWSNLSLLPGHRMGYATACACAVIVLVVVGLGMTAARVLTKPSNPTILPNTHVDTSSTLGKTTKPVLKAEPIAVEVPKGFQKTIKPTYRVTVGYRHGSIVSQRSRPSVVNNASCPVAPKHDGLPGRPSGWQAPTTAVDLNRSNPKSGAEVLTSWDEQRRIKLGDIEFVAVMVDSTSPSEHSELNTLQVSFVRALSQLSEWKVVGGDIKASPEAVIKLRFEPDATCLGVVLAEIRDANGKLLWQDMVGCRALKKGDHETMFADASARLIAKLQSQMKESDDSGKSGTPISGGHDRAADLR